jgi:hypothetical protein
MANHLRASNIAELMDLDEGGKVGEGAHGFDDQLWLLLTNRYSTVDEAQSLPEPVWVYLASRWMEWEVGNGGFPQAAYNIPEWFPLAETAYRKLGLEKAARLIARGRVLLEQGENRDGAFDAQAIGQLFAQFRESELAKLDQELDEADWWADEVRLAYVRRNRDAFRSVEP